jgi:hypothetical protein
LVAITLPGVIQVLCRAMIIMSALRTLAAIPLGAPMSPSLALEISAILLNVIRLLGATQLLSAAQLLTFATRLLAALPLGA